MNPEPALNPKFNFEQIGIGNISPLQLTNHVKGLLETTNDENLVKSDFPYHVFPAKVQEIVLSTNKDLNFPIDFIGASILYSSSVAIGNSTKVQIKSNFQESAVIYLAIVAKAGTNKSQPLSFALQPVF